MATRATYKIEGMTFYCHWDGYPEGAAARFHNMIAALTQLQTDPALMSFEPVKEVRGGAAFAFIRGNLDAAPAHLNAHDGHGDTAFRYTLEESSQHGFTVTMESRTYGSFDERWKAHPAEPLVDFVNRHCAAEMGAVCCAPAEPGVWHQRDPRLALVSVAHELVVRHNAKAVSFADDNPNRAAEKEHAYRWHRAALMVEAETA